VFPDTREALKDLLNLSINLPNRKRLAETVAEADAFISQYGPLRPYRFPVGWAPPEVLEFMNDPSDPNLAVILLAAVFSSALLPTAPRDAINLHLGIIFSPAQIDGQQQSAALKVDILAGTVTPVPRDLLDAVAVEFMRSYKTIRDCERCQRFFFKDYTRDRYCSRPCAEQSRGEAQRDWMREYRADQKRERESKRRNAPKKATLK
jgi:hypothetical protein